MVACSVFYFTIQHVYHLIRFFKADFGGMNKRYGCGNELMIWSPVSFQISTFSFID